MSLGPGAVATSVTPPPHAIKPNHGLIILHCFPVALSFKNCELIVGFAYHMQHHWLIDCMYNMDKHSDTGQLHGTH